MVSRLFMLTNPVLKALVVDAVDEGARGGLLSLLFHHQRGDSVASGITGTLWKYYGASAVLCFGCSGDGGDFAAAFAVHRRSK